MKLFLKPPKSEDENVENMKQVEDGKDSQTIIFENKEIKEEIDVTKENKKEEIKEEVNYRLRPRKVISYSLKPTTDKRKSLAPLKTKNVSILPLPLGELAERVELEEQLRQLESLEMNSMISVDKKTNNNSANNIRFVMNKGMMIREGDYVAVRGEDERVYFAIIYDLFLQSSNRNWPEKLFRMRWLLPKEEYSNVIMGNPQHIQPDHFELGPLHEIIENINSVVDVFYSPTTKPFETRWVTTTAANQLRPTPLINSVERTNKREGLRNNTSRNVNRSNLIKKSQMMQDLEAAHMLIDLLSK